MARLLVVDDNRFYRDRLRELFTKHGHQVETAGNVRDTLDICRHFTPDVLVVDRMLDGTRDGSDLAGSLKRDRPELSVIMITGYPCAEAEQEAREAGAFAFFEKPFDPLELAAAVDRATAK